jgi:hypothetical protein
VDLLKGETIFFGFLAPQLSSLHTRSYFLELRAAYTPPTGIQLQESLPTVENAPAVFALLQNQPNPAERGTTFRFDVPRTAHVRIDVFDLQGRRVRVLLDGDISPGSQAIEWDGRDDRGNPVGPGVYLYRMTSDSVRAEKRLVLLAR